MASRSPQLHLNTPPSKVGRQIDENAMQQGNYQGISLYMNGRYSRNSFQDNSESSLRSPQLNLRARHINERNSMEQSQVSNTPLSHNIYDPQATFGSATVYSSASKVDIYKDKQKPSVNMFNPLENPYGIPDTLQNRPGNTSFGGGMPVMASPMTPTREIGIGNSQPSLGQSQRHSYSGHSNTGPMPGSRASQLQIETMQTSIRVKNLERAISKLRGDHGLVPSIEVSSYGLNRMEERAVDNRREIEYFADAYERITVENKENCLKLRKLHQVDEGPTNESLEGCEDLISQNDKLRNRVKQLKVDLNRKARQKIEAIEGKAKNQLENEANFLTFRYQSDDEALKHDVTSYYQLLQEINAGLRAKN